MIDEQKDNLASLDVHLRSAEAALREALACVSKLKSPLTTTAHREIGLIVEDVIGARGRMRTVATTGVVFEKVVRN